MKGHIVVINAVPGDRDRLWTQLVHVHLRHMSQQDRDSSGLFFWSLGEESKLFLLVVFEG